MLNATRTSALRWFALLFSFLPLGFLTDSAAARTVTVDCEESTISAVLKTLDPQTSNTVQVIGTCKDSVGIFDFADLTIAGLKIEGKSAAIESNGGTDGGAGVVIDGNSEASFWSGGTFTGNQPMDLYCGVLNGIAAAPQRATVGVTNCPNTYK